MLGPGKLDISKWVPKSTMLGPKIDDFCYIFLIDFLLILCLILLLGQEDQIREEPTQSTHRAHAEPWRGNPTGKSRSGCVRCMGTRRRILRTHIRTNMRTQSHEDSHEDAHEDSHEDSHEGSHEYR